MKLGEKIKLVRKHRGLTQRELGERLHLDGNAANRIAQYESGFRTPKEDRIQEIARVLNVCKENFFTRVLSGKLNDVPSGRLFCADSGFLQMCQSL